MKKKTTPSSSAVSKPVAKLTSPPAATPSEAQRMAATILEVLGGQRSPPEAAQALAITLPRYYQLETRALEGLVAALGPRPRGKQPALENRIRLLEKQLDAARRQCARQEALVRVTRRTFGLAIPAAPKAAVAGAERKKRRPTVRALKAARGLQSQAEAEVAATVQTEPLAVQITVPESAAEEVRRC